MPIIETKGAASSQGFGQFASTGEAVYIESVFQTWLYTGNGSTQTITNGIDLSTNGGLVWLKARSAAYKNLLQDTARGPTQTLSSNTTDAQAADGYITSFNTSGFSLAQWTAGNGSGDTYASWTFRKQPKFFDVVTWTGNGAAGARTISHNLGVVPGCIIVKALGNNSSSGGNDWFVWHRSMVSGGFDNTNTASWPVAANLNLTSGVGVFNAWLTNITSTTFNLDYFNLNSVGYVAYLFAHNAGGFGLTGTDNVISCGSYTGNGSATGPTITLGYEPQFVMVKASSTTGNWVIEDTMRGMSQTSSNELFPNTSGAETALNPGIIPTATGFSLGTTNADMNSNGATYIYIAIRRGPMKTPTTGTSVFLPKAYTGTGFNLNKLTGASFSPDTFWPIPRAGGVATARYDKLRGTRVYLYGAPSGTAVLAEETDTSGNDGLGWQVESFNNDGVSVNRNNSQTNATGSTYIGYMFGRAPGFFDVVCYTGTGVSRQISISASFGSFTPELVIYKNRSNTTDWVVWPGVIVSANNYLTLNSTAAIASDATIFPGAFDIGFIRVGTDSRVNASGDTYVAYVFASCPGVSKVGSYTGNGSSQTINCGFTGGARFVLIKRTDASGDWVVFDSARGIVAGNDPFLELNTTAAEQTGQDAVDADSTGFIVNQTTENLNVSAASYIFLAIS